MVRTMPTPRLRHAAAGCNLLQARTDYRYVYSDGYLYEVDPSNYSVMKVIDTYPH